MSSKRAAGRMSTSTCASTLPTLHQSWTTPGGTSTCWPVAATEVEPHGTGDNLEALRYVGVHVLAGDRSARADVEVARQALTAGVLAPLAHHQPVALNPVLVDLARSHHKT